MDFNEMIYKVYTENGTGAVIHYKDGSRKTDFYNDRRVSFGIDRASLEFETGLFDGKMSSIDFYYKEQRQPFALSGERVIVHIYDHNTHKEIKTRAAGRVHDVIRKDGKTGIIWGYDNKFIPLSGFAENVRFEIL